MAINVLQWIRYLEEDNGEKTVKSADDFSKLLKDDLRKETIRISAVSDLTLLPSLNSTQISMCMLSRLKLSMENISIIAKWLENNPQITFLELDFPSIKPSEMEGIIDALKETNVRHLYCSSMDLEEETFVGLVNALNRNPKITKLTLSDECLTEETAALLSSSDVDCSLRHIERLEMNSQEMGDAMMCVLKKMLSGSSVKALNFTTCLLEGEHVEALTKVLAGTKVDTLYIQNNEITPSMVRNLKNRSSETKIVSFIYDEEDVNAKSKALLLELKSLLMSRKMLKAKLESYVKYYLGDIPKVSDDELDCAGQSLRDEDFLDGM